MSFNYKFPAVKGVQAGKDYYISMVPLKLLSKLFPSDDEIVLPEYRAQRKINETRIPEIRDYILFNKNNYVFSALSASIDGDFKFVSIGENDIGILEIDMNAIFLINDGQHRKAAIEAALNEDKSLSNETISIVFFKDDGLARSQQMFTDLNKHAVKSSNSLSTLYDSRDEIAVATKEIIDKINFFKKYTDKERDILGKNSSKLFTLNTIYKANQKILHSNDCTEEDKKFILKFWSEVANNIVEWSEVDKKQLTKKDLRENYIITLSVTIIALGRLGRCFYDNRKLSIKKYLEGLKNIDWSRNSKNWINRIIRDNGKVVNSEEASMLACIRIKELLDLDLTSEEKQKEKQKKRMR